MKTITRKDSLLLAAAALLLAASIFLPWWEMKLTAPQYPEGLYIRVFPYKMTGNLDVINNLNHYVGMKEFNEASFPELHYLSAVIAAFALGTLGIALLRRRMALLGWMAVFAVGGAAGIWDIYRWLHHFGTDLDPKAPIQIPPFVPPIVGTNKLANFQTLSLLSFGALAAGLSFVLMAWVLWRNRPK